MQVETAEHRAMCDQAQEAYRESTYKASELMKDWKLTAESIVRENNGGTYTSSFNPPLMTRTSEGERNVTGTGSSPAAADAALMQSLEVSFKAGGLSRTYSPPLSLLAQRL